MINLQCFERINLTGVSSQNGNQGTGEQLQNESEIVVGLLRRRASTEDAKIHPETLGPLRGVQEFFRLQMSETECSKTDPHKYGLLIFDKATKTIQ